MSLSKKILMLQLHVALQPAVQHPKRSRNNQPFQRLPERAGERRLGISAVAILSDVEMDDGCRKKGETKPSVFLLPQDKDAVALGKAMAETLSRFTGIKRRHS